jgi:hypothetical protein
MNQSLYSLTLDSMMQTTLIENIYHLD